MFRTIAISSFVIGLAAPAAAQDICGLAGGQWIGGSETASDISMAEQYREQMALVLSGNTHVSYFALSSASDVRIEAAGRGNGDPLIELLDADGTLLAEDDDSGGEGSSLLELNLEPGTYCVATASYDGSPMTAFVRVSRPEQERLTQGVIGDTFVSGGPGDCSEAPLIGAVEDMISAAASVNQNDIWRFELPFDAPISVTAENESADPTIVLTSAAGDFIDENDDFDGLNSRIDVTSNLNAGTYCVQVDALSDRDEVVTITVDVYDPQAALAALYARGEAAPPMDGSVPIIDLGVLENRIRNDLPIAPDATWMQFSVPASGLVLIEAIGNGASADPWLALYDDLGRQIALNDDYGQGLDSLITARVNPGDYLLAVKQVGDASALARLVVERYIPAK